jgi:hypothetical protein
MKRHLPLALKSILIICFAGFLLAGCCSTHRVDCIPHTKMPYALYDGRVKCYLTDHLSIDQMIESATEQDFIEKRWPEILREKFPGDKELLAYLDLRDEKLKGRSEKGKATYWHFLWDMKADLEQSQGELYYYHLLGKNVLVDAGNRPAEEEEEGYLILSKGKVFKKYLAGNGVFSENVLKRQGLK